jgi:hypothetical protein
MSLLFETSEQLHWHHDMNKSNQIENRNDLVRDTYSKAILNTDLDALNAWKKRKEKSNRIDTHENDINNIKEELGEIKFMIKEIKEAIKVIN